MKIKLRDCLKHMQRPVKSKADKENEPVEKPPKWRKTKPTRLGDIVEEMDEDRKTFEDDVKEIEGDS